MNERLREELAGIWLPIENISCFLSFYTKTYLYHEQYDVVHFVQVVIIKADFVSEQDTVVTVEVVGVALKSTEEI